MALVPYLDNVAYTTHAIQQMNQRGLMPLTIERTLANGEVIEEYDTDEEGRYLMHWKRELGPYHKHIHVVAADQAHGRTVVITAYDPSLQTDRWSDDFKTRLD